jgi:hypothetical protein
MKSTCFFTIVSDDYYFPVGTHVLVNSFKKYHPDIDLVVFRQDKIDQQFYLKGINFYMAKPTFAKLLTKDYERVVNIDADTIITGRLTEVLDTEWDIGGVWNYNLYENASLENVSERQYIQAGLVGSSVPEFWDVWEAANKKAMEYKRQENDVLNLIWYNDKKLKKYNKVIWDKVKNYLGCKSLGLEDQFYIDNDKLMCMGEQVKAYHWAKGGGALPKMQFERLPFKEEVVTWLYKTAHCGVSVKYGKV